MEKARRSSAESFRRYHIKVQVRRALIYNVATAIGITAKLLGVVSISWSALLLFVAVINGSALVFGFAYAARFTHALHPPLSVLCPIADLGIITWMVVLTGGSRSSWFPWYLAVVAAAGYVLGRRATMVVMAAGISAYIGAVVVTEHADPTALPRAVTNVLMLYGAAFFAVMGISSLQEKRRTIAQLKELESRRAGELGALADTLAAKTRELDAANHLLRVASNTDPLTGLHNRRFLEERIWEDVAVVRRSWVNDRREIARDPRNTDLGFLMADVDHFKRVNDSHGHDAGDEVLAQLADVLRSAVRDTDSVIRWGGEEFLLVTRQTNREYVRVVAERLCALVRDHRFPLRFGGELTLTCSVGHCSFPLGDPDLFPWDEVVRVADEALMLAKHGGRDRAVGIELMSAELSADQHLQVLRDLPAAVRAGIVRVVADRPHVLPVNLEPSEPTR